ncbi:MAG: G5 domain-containing protein [Acidaminococcaceae bacterium]|nr:G5 domain-containing protein [Acidaminococcaceae bacterium]
MKRKMKNLTGQRLLQGLTGMVIAVSALVLPMHGFAESVAPQQVYLDPSQAEAAKRQVEADAKYNANPLPVASVQPKSEEKKPEVKEQEPAAQKTIAAAAEEKPIKEEKPVATQEDKKVVAAKPNYVMPQEQVYLDPSQAEAAKRQVEADAKDNANPLPVASAQPKSEEQKPNAEEQKPEVKEQKPEVKEQKPEVKEQEPEVKEQEPAAQKTIASVAEKKVEEKKSAEKKMEAVKPAEDKKAAAPDVVAEEKTTKETKTETKTEDVAPPAKKPVQLKRFGSAKDFVTHRTTVAEVLKDMKVNLDGRTVYPSPETKITDGMVIHVLGRKSFVSHEEVEVPFQTKIINDPELAFGTKQVEKAGVKGKDIVTYENITRIGYEQKIELDRRHVTAPVDEIVRQGVAQSILTPEGYMRYKKKIYGEATAYTWGGGASGTTSLGLWPKRGIVAVDPRMIPYYTKMYIPGYGMAMAGDTGGAIVGHRIDLFMDTLAECYQWGRRDVEIYILE